MTLTLRRTLAASAASLIVLAGAACSNETAGEGSPGGSSSTSESSEPESSESPTSEAESSASETSPSDAPAGSQTSSDGVFTYSVPDGYADASGQIDVPSAVASAYDTSGASFPTTIVVTKESSQGLSLEQMADAVVSQLEKSFNTTAEKSADFPLDSVDGEELLAYTTGTYDQGGQSIASAIVLTEHDGTAYAFIVNTLAGEESEAGTKLIEFVETVQWT